MQFKHLTLLIMAPALIACGGDNNFVAPPTGGVVIPPPPSPPPPPPPPPPAGDVVDAQGAGFAAAFRADAQAEPVDPMMGDVIAIDKTSDPQDVSNP